MALSKGLIVTSGVPLRYFRITHLSIYTNEHNAIYLNGYVSEEERLREIEQIEAIRERDRLMEEDPTLYILPAEIEYKPVYIEGLYFEHPYDQDMTIDSAYEYLKTLPEFEDAEDC